MNNQKYELGQYSSLEGFDLTALFSVDQWPELYKDRLEKVSFQDRLKYADRLKK